jgi:ATP-dependent Clp protease ATP-binding subunit ClpA
MAMWEPFSEGARRSIVLAQEAAQRLGNNFIGSEHIVLGIVDAGNNIAVDAFASFNVSAEKIWEVAERNLGHGKGVVQQEMVFTPYAKRMIEMAFEESRQLNHNYIGIEHLMLSYARIEGEPPGRSLLSDLDIERTAFREKIIELLPKWALHEGVSTPAAPARGTTPGDFFSNLFARIRALDSPGVHSAVERGSERRLYYIDTEDLWKRLQACVARRDVIGALMYALFIGHREERTPEETFREIIKRIEENYRR